MELLLLLDNDTNHFFYGPLVINLNPLNVLQWLPPQGCTLSWKESLAMHPKVAAYLSSVWGCVALVPIELL